MGKAVSCKDVGADCNWTGKADTEEGLLQKIAEHAKEKHGMPQLSPEMIQKAKSVMRDE